LQRVEVRIFTPARLLPLQARRLQTAFNITFLGRPPVTRWRIAAAMRTRNRSPLLHP